MYKHFINRLPDDIWLVDLDATKLTGPTGNDQDLPPLPEPESSALKNHLKQVFSLFNLMEHQCGILNQHFFNTHILAHFIRVAELLS